jgi:flagellar assembly protein FliH
MSISSRVVKADEAQDFQSWTTHLATLNEEFAPFFSLTAPAQAAPDPKAFAADEVHVLSQNQANTDDWQDFTVPNLNAPSADTGADLGGMSAEDLMIQQQMAMMAEAAGGDFNFNANADTSTDTAVASDDGFTDDPFDDGFASAEDSPVAVPATTEEDAFREARERGYAEGHAAGVEAGITEGIQQGLIDGEAMAQEQAQAVLTQELESLAQAEFALEQVTNVLGDTLLQPMQRLALHMAKELVRGELSLSDAAVTRLVKGCMEQLDLTQDKLQVYLNNDDFQLLQADSMLDGKVSYLPSNDLQPGGVRVEQADSWVDDLLEERLIMLSKQALGSVDNKLLQPVTHLSAEEEIALHEGADDMQMVAPESIESVELESEQDAEVDTVIGESSGEASLQPGTQEEVAEPEAKINLEEPQTFSQTPEEGVENDEDWADLAAAGDDASEAEAEAEADDDDELW